MKKEILAIKERNKRVEIDKAWEVSVTRRAIIALATYIIVVVFLYMIDAPYPWLNALVPAIGFILSTLTLNMFNRIWIRNNYL